MEFMLIQPEITCIKGSMERKRKEKNVNKVDSDKVDMHFSLLKENYLKNLIFSFYFRGWKNHPRWENGLNTAGLGSKQKPTMKSFKASLMEFFFFFPYFPFFILSFPNPAALF